MNSKLALVFAHWQLEIAKIWERSNISELSTEVISLSPKMFAIVFKEFQVVLYMSC